MRCSSGWRREAVVGVGGFDPDCLVEDYELIHRLARHSALHRLGWRSRVVGSAQGRTEAPSSTAAFLRQRRRWFGGFLQTQYWYRGMVGDGRLFGNVGRWMLPVKSVDTMQPIFGLTALGILLVSIAQGRLGVLLPVSAWIAAKIALLAALVEPFSFQVLRHVGATLGWITFLTRQRQWGTQERLAAIDVGEPSERR